MYIYLHKSVFKKHKLHLYCFSTPRMYVFLFVVVATQHDLFTALSLNQLEILYETNRVTFFSCEELFKA